MACIGSGKTVGVGSVSQASVVQGEGAVVIQGGTLEVGGSEASNLRALSIEEGTLTGSATIDVHGLFTWSGGYMSGTGSTVVVSGATGTMSAETDRLLVGRSLVNEGTLSLSGGELRMSQGARIKNSGTFITNSQFSFTQVSFAPEEGTAPLIVNTGLLEKTAGTGTTSFTVALENHGTVQASAGKLEFRGGGSTNSEAKWSASTGDSIAMSHTAFVFKGGTATGAMSVESALTEGTTTFETLTFGAGTLSGPGTVKILSALNWTGGTMSGTGSTIVERGATVTTTGSTDWLLVERTFNNAGTWSLSEGELRLSAGAQLLNTGTFNANAEGSAEAIRVSPEEGESPRIVNRGLFQKTAGSGTTTVGVPFENYGLVNTDAGHLKFLHPILAAATSLYGGPGSTETGQGCACAGEPVLASGDFLEAQTDLRVGGRGVGLSLTRIYNSQAAAEGSKGAFGYGWSNSFGDSLTVDKEHHKATLRRADGGTILFSESGGTFTAPATSQYKLVGSAEAGYTVTEPSQTLEKFSGSSGRLEKVTDRNGNETTLAYEGLGRLEAVTDPAGRKLKFAYNAEGLVETATDPAGHIVKYGYESGTLASVTLPGETKARWSFKVDSSHQVTEMTNGLGGVLANEYNASHQVTRQTDPLKHVLKFVYEPFDLRVKNESTGAETDEQLTSGYEPVSITHGYGTSLATSTSYQYNAGGYITSETDGDGHTTEYSYDSENNRTSMLDPDKHETKWGYDSTHDVTSITTPRGETTAIKRDAHGNAEIVERPAPESKTQSTKYKYGVHGEVESMEDPLKRVWKYESLRESWRRFLWSG